MSTDDYLITQFESNERCFRCANSAVEWGTALRRLKSLSFAEFIDWKVEADSRSDALTVFGISLSAINLCSNSLFIPKTNSFDFIDHQNNALLMHSFVASKQLIKWQAFRGIEWKHWNWLRNLTKRDITWKKTSLQDIIQFIRTTITESHHCWSQSSRPTPESRLLRWLWNRYQGIHCKHTRLPLYAPSPPSWEPLYI